LFQYSQLKKKCHQSGHFCGENDTERRQICNKPEPEMKKNRKRKIKEKKESEQKQTPEMTRSSLDPFIQTGRQHDKLGKI